MKSGLVSVVCVALALPLSAQQTKRAYDGREVIDGTGSSFAELMRTSAPDVQNGVAKLQPKSDVVLEGAEAGFIFAAAGSAGTFRTEAVIYNRRNVAQRLQAYYFPIGGGSANCSRPSTVINLPAGSYAFYTDFVGSVFGETNSFGAVAVLGVNSAGQLDTASRIDGNARIYAPAIGGGTASQLFPAFSLQNPGGFQSAFGLRSDEAFRTNWGIFNYDTNTRTFDIFFDGNRSSTINQITRDIPPCSLVQERVPGGPYGFLEVGFLPRDGRGLYYAYGSTVDNVSTDSYSVPARQ